jgi:hypothetical protein
MAPPLRRTNLAHVLIATACSSADPSTAPGPIQGVSALEQLDCNGYCAEEYVAGAAVGQGTMWITRARDIPNSNGGMHADDAQLALVDFADAGIIILAKTPTYATTNFGSVASSNVGVTADGSKLYFAYDDRNASKVVLQDGLDGGSQQLGPDGVVVGVAAQPTSAVVAVVPSCCGMSCGSGCFNSSGFDQGSGTFNPNGSSDAGAVLYGVNFADGGVMQRTVGIDAQVSVHNFTSDGANVYWIGGGQLWTMPQDFTAAPMASPATIAGYPVGLSTSNGVVAWATVRGTTGTNCSGPCPFTPQGYDIASTNGPIYTAQSSTQFCLGLAIDATYAYFAITEQRTTSNCCNDQDGGPNINTDIYTTGIARVSLTGGASQTPSVIPFSTNRMYGPRRFFVDDTFVYGVDAAFVLRIAKTAFP